MSLDTNRFKIRPTVCVFIYCTDQLGRVLEYTSLRQPLINQKDLPYGKLRLGDTYQQTLLRILTRRDIIVPEGSLHTVLLDIKHYQDNTLISHRTGPCYFIETKSSEHKLTPTKNGYAEWADQPSTPVTKDKQIQEIIIHI